MRIAFERIQQLDPDRKVLAAIFLLYVLLASQLVRCDFLLVNDYRPFSKLHSESVVANIAATFVHPGAEGWLYRPFPELMEILGAAVFRNSPGLWHLSMILLRAATVLATWVLLKRCGADSDSIPVGHFGFDQRSTSGDKLLFARSIGTCFIAVFPAFPETQLIYAESLMMPTLLVALIVIRRSFESSGPPSRQEAAAAGVTVVLLTMSKEVFAPVSFLFLAGFFPFLWRRGTRVTKCVFILMAVACAVQIHHCYLTIFSSYAHAGLGAGSNFTLKRIWGNLQWIAKDSLLLSSNPLLLTSGFVIAFFSIGLVRMAIVVRRRGLVCWPSFVLLALTGCIGIHLLTPYQALRYLYPIGVFIAPILASGAEAVFGLAAIGRLRRPLHAACVFSLLVFSCPCLLAQSHAMLASSKADWALLGYLAESSSQGRPVIVLSGPSNERLDWIRRELEGVNLTGRVGMRPGDFRIRGPKEAIEGFPRNAIFIPKDPYLGRSFEPVDPGPLEVNRTFKFCRAGPIFNLLRWIERHGNSINPWYKFLADAGSTPFPGHYWYTYIRKKPSPVPADSAGVDLK
jgi:hypothetical protein